MYFNIASKNVKKSFKDYSIYFITLTLAVCIFYSFNSIGSQKAFLELGSVDLDIVDTLMTVIGYISVFVSVVLGGLIIYGNKFLIKKRKKEFGTYMVLGMGKWSVSRILVIETLLVGLASLFTGLLLGIGVSQGVSIFTTSLFEVPMESYSFVLSGLAIKKTIIYFGIMFGLSIIFNVISVSRYKVIDLLMASRVNERVRIASSAVYAVLFILSLGVIGLAYGLVNRVGFNPMDIKFSISVILGIVGTVLFFYSLSGWMVYAIRKTPGIYHRGINAFTVKQLASKINTNFMSMSIISLMLFMTISVLSTGISFKEAVESNFDRLVTFDASISTYQDDNGIADIEEAMRKAGFNFDKGESYGILDIYDMEYLIMDVFELADGSNKLDMYDSNLNAISISAYNGVRELRGEEPVELKEDEVLVLSNFQRVTPAVEDYLASTDRIELGDKTYKVKGGRVIESGIYNDSLQSLFPTLVLRDEELEGLDIRERHLNINYSEQNRESSEAELVEVFNKYRSGDLDYEEYGFIIGETREQMIMGNRGTTTIVLFIGIYLGIVFLVTSMAVLGLQQLSEASDSRARYASLRKIGASEGMIEKSIFRQVGVQFTAPLLLAVVHSLVAIGVMNKLISLYGKPDLSLGALITTAIFVVIYGGYFAATYSGYKSIVKTSN